MTTHQLFEEKDLLSLVAHSDEKAFHKVYQRYFGKVYGMTLSYFPDALMAQDLVQEVFIRVWLNRSDLHQIQNFEAWIITITRNLLIKELRRNFPPGWQPEAADAHDPHQELSYQELEKLLAEAVGKLSTRQQQVYRLSREQGFSHKEIAHQLGISVDVSREHLSKALQSIRYFLVKQYGMTGVSVWVVALMQVQAEW